MPEPEDHPGLQDFYGLIREYPERGGKRLRGLLVLLSAAAHGAGWRRALGAAAALELFQNWVLIHDDIEDDSSERRGQPALHKQAGMPVALNAGDALHVLMWQRLHALEGAGSTTWLRIVGEFEQTIRRTAEGQHLDLCWVRDGRFDIEERDYLRMVALKTARYTVVSPLRLGALCAGAEPDPRLDAAGEDLGIAFQIRDDVLDLAAGAATGKEFAGDLYESKRTLILAHLFAHASPADREAARAALAKPRCAKTARDIAVLLGAIGRSGSADYAQRVADERAQRGLAILGEALGGLPGQHWVQELARLLESLARRAE